MRARLAGPQLRRLFDTNHNLALRLHVVHRLHSPGIPQHQKLLKQFFGYYCSPYSTRFPSYYPLQTSRNRNPKMQEELEEKHMGKWVLFHNETFFAVYGSFEAAADDAVRRFGRGPYLIRQVGSPPVVMPAS